jgi:A/G-specific adenine glycosylase
MQRFPSVTALAAAAEEEVHAAWSGLGYYRRASQLWRAARIVAREHQGSLPRSVEALRALPGIGRYTAGAISSMAFGEAAPAIDGNVERVLSRWLGIRGDPRRSAARRHLAATLESWLRTAEPGAVNQALMDLGATVCLPRVPHCAACPLADACIAVASGTVETIPPPRRRRERQRRSLLALWIEAEGRLLLQRRDAAERLLPGTWQLPWIEIEGGSVEAAKRRLAARLGDAVEAGEEIGFLRHSITHRELAVRLLRGRWRGGADALASGAWFAAEEVPRLPHSSLLRKAWKLVAAAGSAGGAGGEDVPADDLVVDFAQALGDETAEDLEQP